MLDGVVIDDADLFNERLQQWEDFYDVSRPHRLGVRTPLRAQRRPWARCERAPVSCTTRLSCHRDVATYRPYRDHIFTFPMTSSGVLPFVHRPVCALSVL